MKKTLNLTIDEAIIARAKRYAKANRTSVSAIVEEELAMRTRDAAWKPKPGSLTAKISGSMPLPETGKSDNQLITEALNEKYGLDTDRH
jgi:hypothetical protein